MSEFDVERFASRPDVALTFMPAAPEAIDDIQNRVGKIADSLGTTASQLVVPEIGFLTAPLTDKQRSQVTAEFDTEVSRHFVAVQDDLRPVTITESGERMVDMQAALSTAGAQASFSTMPITTFGGEWAGKPRVFWGRKGVVEKISSLAIAYNAAGLAPHFEMAFDRLACKKVCFATP